MSNQARFWMVISIAAVLVGGYFVWQNNQTAAATATRADWINNIMNHVIDNPTNADFQRLLGYQDGYLQAWNGAIDVAAKSFTYGGKNYDTTTGNATN